MSLDSLMGKRYTATYTCLNFACDAWELETGQKLNDKVLSLLTAKSSRVVAREELNEFELLKEPVSPCVVILRKQLRPLHIGIYVRGKVIHLTDDGVRMQPLDHLKLCYDRLRYYK